MGKRGPPPKPSKVKKLQGTHRKDRAARNELEAKPGVPAMPRWLDAEGKREWSRVVPQLEALGILSDVDGAMLADYCAAHALAVKATKAYQRQGTMVTQFGNRVKNPNVKIAQEARAQARLLAGEFGLSPSSRSRISAPGTDEGLSSANARMKAAQPGPTGAAELDKAEKFLFRPQLVPPAPAPKVEEKGPIPAESSALKGNAT